MQSLKNSTEALPEGLAIEEFTRISHAALEASVQKGADYYGWKNSPEVSLDGTITHTSGWGEAAETRNMTPSEGLGVMNEKLNGAYGERFIMSLGTISALINNGYNVRFVQFQSEPGVPFDAAGWTVIVVESMPLFHISPEDLRCEGLGDLVEVLESNESPDVCWKQTNKIGEFQALLAGAAESGLDLVWLAQSGSAS